MKKFLILALVVGSLVLAYGPQNENGAAGGARPDKGQWQHEKGHGDAHEKQNLIKELNLSKEQVKALDKLREDEMKATKDLRKELRGAHIALRKELAKGTIDDNKVNEASDKIIDVQRKLLVSHISLIKNHRKILTPEQQTKLNELMEKREDKKMEERVEHGFFGDMGMGSRPSKK